MILRLSLFTALFLIMYSLSGQLEWAVRPLLETPVFSFDPERCSQFVIVGERGESQRVMRPDGTFAFGGSAFKTIDAMDGCFHTGLNLNDQKIAFTADEWMITDDYDAVEMHTRSDLVIVQKGDLFGLVYLNGSLGLPLRYESIYRLKHGKYKVRLPSGEEQVLEIPEKLLSETSDDAATKPPYTRLLTNREIFREENEHENWSYFWGIKTLAGDTLLTADRYLGLRGASLEGHRVIVCKDVTNGKIGILDSTARVVVPFVYDEIKKTEMAGKYLVAQQKDTASLINWLGEEQASMVAPNLRPLSGTDLLIASFGNGVRLLNLELEPVLRDTFDEVYRGGTDKVFLKKGRLRGIYSNRTGLYTKPRFTRLGGPFARAVLPVAEALKIGFYDAHAGKMLTPFAYDKVKGEGGFFHASKFRQDTLMKNGKTFTKRRVENYLLDLKGKPLIGPSPHLIKHVTKSIYAEYWSKDTVMLYDFEQETTQMIAGKGVKVGPQVVRRSANDFVLTTEQARKKNPRSFTSLRELKGTKLFVYPKDDKYGLMTVDEQLSPAQFSTVKLLSPERGVKVELDGKWGVLRVPEAYRTKQ